MKGGPTLPCVGPPFIMQFREHSGPGIYCSEKSLRRSEDPLFSPHEFFYIKELPRLVGRRA